MPRIFIGIPFLNRPDLLDEALATMGAESYIYVVNNNSVDQEINEQFQALVEKYNLDTYSARFNLGVAASWNRIVMRAVSMGFEYIYVGSNDILMHDGVLDQFVAMDKEDGACIWLLNHFNFFCLHKRFISRVGWFDENFYPAYYEDNDFIYRCKIAGLDVGRAPEEMKKKVEHKGSQTIHSDPVYGAGNNKTFSSWNATHYRMKWGGMPGHETYKFPYDNAEHDHRWWPDPQGSIAHRDWDNGRERVR